MPFLHTLGLLLFAHALADFPLQGDYLARAKNHRQPIPGTPWWIALLSHAAIHGGGVLLVTGSTALALAEVAAHSVVDWLKCDGRLSFTSDQALHVLCKVFWTLALFAAGGTPDAQ